MKEQFKFKILPKADGQFSAQGKIQYNGPLRRKHGMASIKLDLTTDEILVLTPQKKKVHHPYSDEPTEGIWANCYAFEEVIGEKIRALGQRARPRDLYDVVHFFRNRNLIKNPQLVYNVLLKKCDYKKITVPTYRAIKEHEKIDELESQWQNMLAHQLPTLPPLKSFWQDLEPFFVWLEGNLSEERLVKPNEFVGTIFRPGRVTRASSVDATIQKIQFAAANRICVEMTYNNKTRTIEPLSFRQSNAGNKLFYGFERKTDKIKAFSLSNIQDITITNESYSERNYPVEINASGEALMPYIKKKVGNIRPSNKRSTVNFQHIVICNICGKRFKRKNFNSRLNAHKDKNGFPCYGRIGTLVR